LEKLDLHFCRFLQILPAFHLQLSFCEVWIDACADHMFKIRSSHCVRKQPISHLAEMHAQMTSLPFLYGFTCERWKKFIDCILEKSPGVVEIHTVRIIVLVEGQWNTALKHYYPRLLMSEAETTGIHGDQWGGRYGRTAPDLQLRKMMFWEYGRFARLTLGGNYGDLQSCYDRIMSFFSNIAARKKGMWKENCICRALTLLHSERHVKTATGVSKGYYTNEAPELNQRKNLIEGEDCSLQPCPGCPHAIC
jgi:hypothetical protein